MKNSLTFKKIKKPIITFAAVSIIYLLFFALLGFYPFGGRSIAWCDLEQQYVPLLMELRGIIKSGDSLLLGKGGGGMNLWGVFLFFVSSPLSLLSLLVKEEKMIYFINLLTILKLAFCGSSASYYFQKIFRSLPDGFNILLSIMYSFSGYAMMYYQNNMWLDIMIVFPLLLLSMFRLCSSGKWGAYAILLSISMFMNFYISYMLVVFIVISFGIMMIFCCKREHRGDRAVKFILADICAALISAVVWLPAFKQFCCSGRGESTWELFINGFFFEDSLDKMSLLMCTPIILSAIIIMVFRRELFKHGRAAFFAVMTLILLAGTFVSPINKIWHTGSYQAYPLRYGFIIILFAFSICAVLLSKRRGVTPKLQRNKSRQIHAMMILLVLIYTALIIPAIIYSDRFTSYVTTLRVNEIDATVAAAYGIIAATLFTVFIINYRRRNITKRFSVILMTFVMLSGSYLNFNIYFGNITDVTERFNQTMTLTDKIDDSSYFRAKSMKRYFYSNMLEAIGFNSIGHYTSLTNRDFLFTAKQLGYSAYWLDTSTNGGTLITDAFLMNKYLIGVSSDMNSFYQPYNAEDTLKIYSNTIVSEGAVISSVKPEELLGFNETSRMESSAYIAEKVYGAVDIITTAEPYAYENLTVSDDNGQKSFEINDSSKDAYINYSLFVSGKCELYFDLFSNYTTALTEPYFGAVSIYVNGNSVEKNFPNKKANGIIDLGTYENKYVSIKIVVHKAFTADSFGVYLLDGNRAAECIEGVKTGLMEVDGNKIKITAESPDEGYIYIPIAYSKGYKAELNGEKTAVAEVLSSFMAVKLERGSNELILTYYPDGFIAGMIISILGVVAFILLMLRGKNNNYSNKIKMISEKSVIFSSLSALVLIYIIASVAWIIMQFGA